MTFTEAKEIVGKTGLLKVERNQLVVIVSIVDARSVFGRTEVLVEPTKQGGHGSAWVAIERVQLS